MKNQRSLVLIGILVLMLLIVAAMTGSYLLLTSGQDKETSSDNLQEIPFEQDLSQVGKNDLQNHAENLNIDTAIELTSDEKSDLIYMREEEKLARDIYLGLYEKWGLQIFNNISSSEQKHTDSIKTLIDAYNLNDPFINEIGRFSNTDLQDLYSKLLDQGSISEVEALKVGALIEDLDIVDLEKAMSKTKNVDILTVYENLQRGSRNHIRSFTQTLSRYGESYTPIYLNETKYYEIINGASEKGNEKSGTNGYRGGNL